MRWPRLGGVAAHIAFWVGLLGCEGPRPGGPLPDLVTSVVRLDWGYRSLAVELTRPGTAPKLMVSPGILAMGPGWGRVVHIEPIVGSDGSTRYRVSIRDLAPESADGATEQIYDGDVEILSLDQGGAWVRSGETRSWLTGPGAPEQAFTPGDWGGTRSRRGPGRGFQVRREADRLELLLPRMDRDHWAPVMTGVVRVLGTWWLTRSDLPDWQLKLFEEDFKQVAAVAIDAGTATFDGVMGEWRDARALPVDSEAQVLDGRDYWSGPRDGSFGVAARRSEGGLILAIRVRDDAVLPGQDALVVATSRDRVHTIPVATSPDVTNPTTAEGRGWRAAFTGQVDMGFGVEVALDRDEFAPDLGSDLAVLPLVVHYLDRDPDEGSVTLGTAPLSTLGPEGSLGLPLE